MNFLSFLIDILHRLIDRYEERIDKIYNTENYELFKWQATKTWQTEWNKPADAFASFADRFSAARKDFDVFIDGKIMHPSTGVIKLWQEKPETIEHLFKDVLFAEDQGDVYITQQKDLWEIIQEAEAQLEKEDQAARQSPNLITILNQYLEQRNAGAWSKKAKVKNLQDYAQLFNMLYERRLVTLADFENNMRSFQDKSSTMTAELKAKSSRMKELQNLIRYADDFRRLRPLYDELNAIKFKKKRDAFYAEHESELRLFYLAKRKLAAVSPEHKFPVPAWKKELRKLEVSYKKQSEELEPIRQELKELYRIKGKIDYILRQQNKEAEQDNKTNQKKEEYL